jgi:hypothetical protein
LFILLNYRQTLGSSFPVLIEGVEVNSCDGFPLTIIGGTHCGRVAGTPREEFDKELKVKMIVGPI